MKKISVIMGIYNCAPTLPDAIESIYNQTYQNWELIMCDDGSNDETYKVAYSYLKKDPERIILLRNETNKGLNHTLNHCLSVASGEYIARMDGDDLCSEDRFEKEAAVLDSEKEISIVSTDMSFFDETGEWGYVAHPTYPVKKDFVSGPPFCHAPCLVRKEAYEAVNGYSESKWLIRVEDYHLWLKMYAKGYKGKNIHENLYQMRDDRNAYSRRKLRYRFNEAYVKILVVKDLKLPLYYYLSAFRPILIGLLPHNIYNYLHKKSLRKSV